MRSLCVVDVDDFFDQMLHSLLVCFISIQKKVMFEDSINSFSYSVGVRIIAFCHARRNLVFLQQFLISVATVLQASTQRNENPFFC